MGAGNDTIDFDDSSVSKQLTISTGAGDDLLRIVGGGHGAWRILTGTGDDPVFSEGLVVFGEVSVQLGAGADFIETNFESIFRDDVTMETASGNDTVRLEFSIFDGDVLLNGGAGTDDFEDVARNEFNGALVVKNFEM